MHFKKYFILFISASYCFLNLTSCSKNKEPYKYNSKGLQFDLNSNGNYILSGIGECSDSILYIPDSYNGRPVEEIGSDAFLGCSSLIAVLIPDSIVTIGSYAFSGCSSLQNVGFSNSVTSIGDYAFYGCSSLFSIEIPKSVTSIGENVFGNCGDLQHLSVNSNNEFFDSRNDCNAIINTANNELICGCHTTIIPNSVNSIGNYAFYCNSFLFSIEIPNSVTSIGDYSFWYCPLSSIEIPNSVTSIGDYSFEKCHLRSISFPVSLTSIGAGAFSGNLFDSIYIPNTILFIGEGAFSNNWLNTITVDKNSQYFDSRNDCNAIINTANNELICGCKTTFIPNSVTSIGNRAFTHCSSITEINLPNSVTSIGDSSFSYCSSLTSINIPDSVTSIGVGAFEYCDSLTAINLPNSLTLINNALFMACSSLKTINIPNSVTSIGDFSFEYCSSLTSIYIPSSIVKIGSYVFYNCPSLESIIVDKNNKYYDSRDNCNAIILSTAGSLLYGCVKTIIPNSINHIAFQSFYNCPLSSICIPENITYIEGDAFTNCSSLTSIIFNGENTRIQEKAFSNCQSLTSIIVPKFFNDLYNLLFQYGNQLTIFSNETKLNNGEILEQYRNLVYCYSETYKEGNYWHYVNNIPTKW